MDINTLLSLLQGYLSGQTLTVPAKNTLQSPAIDALLANVAFYPAQELKLTLDPGTTLQIVDGTIPATGIFDQAFLGQTMPRSTARFFVIGGVAQLVQTIEFPSTWAFPQSFPALAGSVLDAARFAAPAFVLASAESAPYAPGLNFEGVADLASPGFAPFAWIWPGGAQQRPVGTVVLPADVAKDVPTIALAAAQRSTTIVMPGVTYDAALTVTTAPASSSDAEPTIAIGIASTLDAGGGLAPFALDGDYDPVNGIVTPALEGPPVRLTSLDQLVALAGGSSLSNLIPSQFSLGDLLLLTDLRLQLLASPPLGGLAAIAMTVALDVEWTLVPDLVTLQQIRLTFVVGMPTTGRLSLTASIGGRFILTNPDKPDDEALVDLAVLLPSLIFTGSLVSGTIDLVGAVAHFFGSAPSLDALLPIVALDFSVDVANRTYALERATVKPSDTLALTMGSDLPEAVSILQLQEISLALRRSPTLFAATISALVELLGATWNVTAAYTGAGGWVFSAALAKTWKLLELIEGPNAIVPASWNLALPSQFKRADVTALAYSYDFGASTFSFTGAAELELVLTDSLRFEIDAGVQVRSARPGGKNAPAQYSGSVRGTISLNDISLTVVYAFQPNNTQISFIFEQITGTYDTNNGNPFVRVAFGDTTLGGILEFLIGLGGLGPAKLPPPWDVLNSISLNGLQITIYLNTKAIQVVYPIGLDLGFIKINKITLDYKTVYGQSQLELSLDASFLGQSYPALGWNPTTQAPPPLPGAGSALFDLQYFALGQHVALRNTDPSKPLDTVGKVIAALRNALTPVPNPNGNPLSQLPGLAFDASSNWLIGAQFTIAGTFSMSLVFNDPNVYGLLISLAGEKAGIFKGLQFEILYRKVTDSIGVYHIELKLPDAMRRLQMGSVTITLPVVALDIYTNGDFRIDMGFPVSLNDFSRSFAIEVFPFAGAGGFYFAKLSGDTSLKVPKIDNGRFSPVIEFGIALAVGLGKSISLGILSGGISITINGMIQGVYGSFEPTDAHVPSATFFSLNGTVAVVGKVYATVNFGIVQADVSLTVYAAVSLRFQTYEPIFIEVSAGVDVRVSIKIVFFRVSFSFSATIRESFTIGSRSTPPWHVVAGSASGGGALTARTGGERRLRAQRGARRRTLLAREAHPRVRALRVRRALPARFSAAATIMSVEPITIYATPVVTKARTSDLAAPGTPRPVPDPEVVALSALLMIENAVDASAVTPEETLRVAQAGAQSDFNRLLARVLRWTIETLGAGYPSVTSDELAAIANALNEDSTFEGMFGKKSLNDFLTANVAITLRPRPTSGDLTSVAFFPMIPALSLTTPNYGFDFGVDRPISAAQESLIAEYFSELAADYANPVEQNPSGAPPPAPRAFAALQDETIATFLFRRWFLLLAQGAVQAASELLERYVDTIDDPATASLASIAAEFSGVTFTHVSHDGETLAGLAQEYDALPSAIVAANPGVDFAHLAGGITITIPVQVFVAYFTRRGDTPASIADEFGTTAAALEAANPQATFGPPNTVLAPGTSLRVPVEVTPSTIVAANAGTTGILRTWGPPTGLVAGAGDPQRPVFANVVYQVVDGDSIDAVAKRFGVDVFSLMGANAEVNGLFRPGGVIALGDLTTIARPGDTLQTIATFYGLAARVPELLAANPSGIPLVAQQMIVPGNPDRVALAQGTTLVAFAQANATSVAELLAVNAAILVVPNTSIVLPKVTYATTGSTISVVYLAVAGETLGELAERFLGADTPENQAAIQHENPTLVFPLAAPAVVTIAAPETPANLLGTFAVPPQTLASPANTANVALLAPRAVMTIPPIEPVVTASDSFETLAQRYNLTLDEVAEQLATTQGLFRDADPELPQIAIPYVPALALDQLVAEIAASSSANQTSAMASRFLMAGLRIPNPADPAFVADPHDPALRTYPLLALTGQEFPAPLSDPAQYTLAFDKTGDASWLTVPGGTLSFALSPDEAAQVTEFASITLQPNVVRCERIALSSTVRAQRALETSTHWQAGESPVLPATGNAAGEPTLWQLPDALRTAIAPISPDGVPYELAIVTPAPSGAPAESLVRSARWATTVTFTIARVPSESNEGPNLAGTFLVVGADQQGTETLLALMRALASDAATLYLLYAPDASDPNGGGLVSDALDRTQVVLMKTNLSTLSNGTPTAAQSERALRMAALTATPSYSATLGKDESLAFVELLWECSVVRSGGFYLSYRASDGTSFPDAIFDGNGQTTITLVALLDSQPSLDASLLRSLNDAVVVGENVDSARSTLFARAAVHTVGPGETLATVAASFPLVTPSPTAGSVAQANATVHHLLDPQQTILVKGVAVPIGPLDTFASIALAHGTDPSALGTENASRPILQAGALVQPLDGMLTAAATQRPGNSGFFVARVDPQQPPTEGRALGSSDAQSEVDTLFNLLGFSIVANATFSASGEGIPVGPTHAEGDPNWNYLQTLAAYAFARPEPLLQIVPASLALPPADENPYAGIAAGSDLDLDLVFHDVHGNLPGIAALRPPIPVGYTDDLLPVSSWPSTATSYAFGVVDGAAALAVDWRFSAAVYMPAPGADYPVTHDKARVDRQQIVTAYYQTRMPDVRFGLETSIANLQGDVDARAAEILLALQGYLADTYVFTTNAAALPAVEVATAGGSTPDTLASVAAAYETVPGTLAQANANADATALLGAHAQVNIPRYYRVATGDTLRGIATAILPNGTEPERVALVRAIGAANAALPLLAGTALIAKARAVTIVPRDGDLASVSAIAASQGAAILGDPLSGLTGIGTANGPVVLGAGITLAYQDCPSLVVGTHQSLSDVVAIFRETAATADADGVAQTNRFVQRFFADDQIVTLPSYVARPDDTLASVAQAIGTAGTGDPPAAQLLVDNIDVADVFPPGTALFLGLTTYAVQEGDTLQSIADAFAITIEDLGARNAILPLQPNQMLRIPFLVDARAVATSTYRADGSESIAAILEAYAAWKNDPGALAEFTALNRYVAALFDPAKPITIGTKTVHPTLASTIDTLAPSFGLEPLAFVTTIAPTPGYLRAGATLFAVAMTASANETLADVAQRYRCTVGELADANASVYGLVASGQTVVVGGYSVPTGEAETFTTLAARVNAARAANAEPPWIAPADVAAANPQLRLQAATLVSPVRGIEITVPAVARYDAAIAPVTVTLTQTREIELVDPEFTAVPSVFSASVAVAPQPSVPGSGSTDEDPLFSLRMFAERFEAAFPGLKLATGADADYGLDAERAACGTVVPTTRGAAARAAAAGAPDPLANRRLWTVNLGTNGAQSARFNYDVRREGVQFYAYPPLTTSLWDSGDMTVQEYVGGEGLTGSKTHRFEASEPDQWARVFLATIDGVLTPASAANLYTVPAQGGGKPPLDAILDAKNDLAASLRDELITIFGDGDADGLTAARERFYQELLVEIASAYADEVLVQYPFTIASGCTNAEVAARLSGKPLAKTYRTPQTGAVNVGDVALALGVSVTYLEDTIATMHFLVAPQVATTLDGRSYTTGNDDTLASLAAFYGVTLADLVAQIEIVTPGAGLLRNDAVVNVTRIARPITAGQTLVALATAMGGTVIEVVRANAELPHVFAAGSSVSLPGYPTVAVPAAGSFASVAAELTISLDALGAGLWNADVTAAANAYVLDAGAGIVLTLLAAPPPYTFTTGKVPLANGTSYLTSIFDVKDAGLERSVFLDLAYAITEMEYDIVQDENALGAYQASSWLSFVLPILLDDPATPNDGDLGPAEIPIPLRAYPQPFVLDNAQAEYPNAGNGEGDTIFEWSYAFRTARTMAPQDTAGLSAVFNVPDAGGASAFALAAAANRDPLFRQLAQFAYVYPALSADLALLGLAERDAVQTKRVTSAVTTLVTLAQRIAAAWRPTPQVRGALPAGGDLYTFRLQTIIDESRPAEYAYLLLDQPTGAPDFAFTLPLSYTSDLVAGPLDAQMRAAFAKQGYPLSANAFVTVVTSGATWTITDADEDLTFVLTAGSTSIVVARAYLWPVLAGDDGTAYPASQIGASTLYTFGGSVEDALRLRVTFDRMQVIGKQNAIAGMSVTRNANLVPGRTTDAAFVYETPVVALPGVTTPSSVIADPVDLRSYLPAGASDLAAALGGFFDVVFGAQIVAEPGSSRQIAIEGVYAYPIASDNPVPVRFPLALVPQYDYAVSTDGDPANPSSFVARFAAFVAAQAEAAGIPAATGAFAFRFTVYSTLAGGTGARPLLRFDDLVFTRETVAAAAPRRPLLRS
ncbi:MAG TPA: LysM peptidoglycan-binding domain-containing protein [Candidatus Limnocylindria bacterium]|nr:LysM peptidoglycan-binding domain-containing protein [Candidatus Limnocylindria bacterium]